MTIFVDKFDVDGVEVESTLQDDLSMDKLNLSHEFEIHSERYSFYATAYELCLDRERRLKAGLARAYAVLDVQARAQLKANGIKIVEKKVENVVITSQQYVILQDDYFESQRMTGLLKAARDSMIHKKECMISLGANMRAELASDPSLLQEIYRRDKDGR